MSIAELRKQSDANRIIKSELMKLKKAEINNPVLQQDLIVDAEIQVDDLNNARRILRKNLSSVMPMDKVDEIISDPNIVDDTNIQLINEKWKEFGRQLKDGTQKLSLDRFKVVFKDFIDKLTNPVDEQQLSKLQFIEQALRDIALEQSRYAPVIEKVINDLKDTNLSIDDVNDILGLVNDNVVNIQEIMVKLDSVKKEDGEEPQEQLPVINNWTLDDILKDSNSLNAQYGRNDKDKVAQYKEQLKQILISSPPEDVKKAISQLKKDELKAYENIITGLSRPKERMQLEPLFNKMNPVVREFRNNKLQEYLASNIEPNEARQKTLDDSKAMFGYGLKNISSVVEFGALHLNMNKLKNENKLKLTYKNGNALKEIKLTTVSDKFIDMVMDIVNGKKFSDRKFSMLPEDEKYLYQVMLKKSKLAGDLDVRLDKLTSSTIDELKNEWELTLGQINSGNDSPTLIKRAKELIKIFMDKKMISKSEGLKMLMNIN